MSSADFHGQVIRLFDAVCPTLSVSEQVVAMQIFAWTVAEGSDDCEFSIDDLRLLTNQNPKTVMTALRGLEAKGLVTKLERTNPRAKQRYCFHLGATLTHKKAMEFRHPRYRRDVLPAKQSPALPYSGIVDRLSEDDRRYLDMIVKTLPEEKAVSLRRKAVEVAGDREPYKVYLEMVAMAEFGPRRLERYLYNKEGVNNER